MQNLEKNTRRLAEMQLWAAEQMNECAQITTDPQLKKKYQQITALNRSFYEIFAADDNHNKSRGKIVSETDMLMHAYYCQCSLTQTVFSVMIQENRPDRIDEVCDRQIMICRELMEEAQSRTRLISN